MFSIMFRRVALARARARGIRSKLPFMRTTFEVSIATSVPLPMAIPMSARASDGLSLIPSPTKATISPAACRFLTNSALSSGKSWPYVSVRPSSSATRSTVFWLSPDKRSRFLTPSFFKAARSSLTPARISSFKPKASSSCPFTATRTRELPALVSSSMSFSISFVTGTWYWSSR